MRYLFWLWFMPLALFWGWFGLSYYDVNFGLTVFSRDLHDLVFHIYGSLLGIDPARIPVLFLRACIFDTGLIFAIVAFRKRREIRRWWAARKAAPDDAMRVESGETVPAQLPAE